MKKKYVVLCELSYIPYLRKYCKIEEKKEGTFIETDNPILCQKSINNYFKDYKLVFGNSYQEIMEGKYFTL